MKEWANKPTSLVTTGSSPLTTTSLSTSLQNTLRQRDLSCLTQTSSSSASVVKTSSSLVKTSGSLVRTSAPSVTLTGGSSTVTASSSSASTGLSQRAAAGAAVAGPVAAGTVVGGVAAVFYGVSNMIKYGEHKKTGAQAVKDTVKNSAGLGLAAGLGVAAAHSIAGTSLALGSAVVVPLAAGVAAGYISARIWNKIFFKGQRPS